MLPAPSAEGLLIIGLLSAVSRGEPKRCSAISHCIIDFLGAEPPKVRVLNESIPELRLARSGAASILHTKCVVCSDRDVCPDPVCITPPPRPS